MAVLLVCRVDDRGRGHDPHFEIGNASLRKAEPLGGRARHIELALAPIRTGVVDANDRRAAVFEIADQKNCAIGIDRTCGTVGLIRPEGFAGRCQAARVVAVATAIIIIGGLERLILADDRHHFRDAQDPVADAVEAVSLSGGFGFDGRDDGCRQCRS